MQALSLSLFGGFSLAAGDKEVEVRSQKARALLSYLALNPLHRESRERLAGLLWSESEENLARASLRQTLRGVRQAFDELGLQGFDTGRAEARFDSEALEVDVWAVLERAERGEASPELLHRKGLAESFLAGFEDVDPSFRAWLMVQRQTIHERLVNSLEAAVARAEADPVAAKSLAVSLINLDPTHEGACRRLMRIYAGEGDIAGALRCYNGLWDLLDSDYDMEPSDETQELVAQIKSGTFRAQEGIAALPTVADPPGTSLAELPHAVLPSRKPVLEVGEFTADDIDPARSYIVQGFRHELIASLVRFRDWIVIEGGEGPSPQGNGRTPTYSIRAAAYPEGAGVKLVLTLKDRETGHYVWSDRHVLTIERWFDAQQLIVRRIAVAMNVHLSAERLTRIAGEPDVSLAVYDRWLRGQELSFRWRPDDETRAENIFRSIIDEGRGFAPAYSSLVQIMNSRHHVFPGIYRNSEREQEALNLAKTSVEIDPLDSKTHLCLAWSRAMNGQYDQAELSYLLARDLNENDPWTLVSSAQGLAFCDGLDEARKLADQALDLGLGASALHWGYQVGIRFLCGDYEACVAAAERANDIIYNLPAWKASALAHLGREEEARDEANRFLNLIRSRWRGEEEASDEAIVSWLLHCFPIRRLQAWENLRDGLVSAGLPRPVRFPDPAGISKPE